MRVTLTVDRNLYINWQLLAYRVFATTLGTIISAIVVLVFFVPGNFVPAGLSGIAVILNSLYDTPIGLAVFFMNFPILYLAYRTLGGWAAVLWIFYVSTLFSVSVDLLAPYFPADGVTNDRLLNALFAGIIGGFGSGLVLRGGATFGGTSTIARILQYRFGLPISNTYTAANLLVIVGAGILLGWEAALLSIIAIMMEGAGTDYILEGPSVVRTVTIVTNKPREVADAVLYKMQVGVTGWEATGMYSEKKRNILFIAISRSRVSLLKALVLDTDPKAFVVVGQGHTAYGADFTRKPFIKRLSGKVNKATPQETEVQAVPVPTEVPTEMDYELLLPFDEVEPVAERTDPEADIVFETDYQRQPI